MESSLGTIHGLEIPVHLLTCPQRAEVCERTMASWRAAGGWMEPHLWMDEEPVSEAEDWGSAGRGPRLSRAYRRMLEGALAHDYAPHLERQWILLLEDDLEFHPTFFLLARGWLVLLDPTSPMASFFNPSLTPANPQPDSPTKQAWDGVIEECQYPTRLRWRAFAAEPTRFLGAQALLLRRGAIRRALARWDMVPGMQAQKLATILGTEGPIWVHQPSLVQHLGEDSSWGARPNKALDFNPLWRPAH